MPVLTKTTKKELIDKVLTIIDEVKSEQSYGLYDENTTKVITSGGISKLKRRIKKL